MSPKRLQLWITLSKINRIGWSTSKKLLSHFESIEHLFDATEEELEATGASNELVKNILSAKLEDISKQLSWLEESQDHFIIYPDHRDYPRLLKESPGAPILLYAKGKLDLIHSPQIAVVGTRNPTVGGKNATSDFAGTFAKNGLVVTSGLALGIDGFAHQAALRSGGYTIAVAGTGLDRVYPARHKSLAYDIAEQGLLLSEFELGTGVRGTNFPRRNRIISGLSLGVLVVEAAIKSGSLITAQYALEQGRDVFAIPGSIHNPMAKGCHWLIKEGAHLVEDADDILQHLGWLAEVNSESMKERTAEKLSPEQNELLNQIDFSPTPLDDLVERCKKSVAELHTNLLTLELEGWIVSSAGGFQRQK
ncbi:DNA-processing protein DprA [Pleionea sediminis]|uniref:DNA-processing protein DprA n=1 Tax=Pleionea sediminis TaxID=2569479 RepID=UPI0011858C10|nr:DNA-processing protein DprA [Pleionea sediminis]